MSTKKEIVYWTREFQDNITNWLETNHPLFMQEWNYYLLLEKEILWNAGHNPYNYDYLTGLIDRTGKDKFLFNTGLGIKWVPYQEYPKTNFADCMFEAAQNIADTGKTIDFFWSGGLDSTASLLAFNELGLEKQLHVIMGGKLESPDLFEKIVKGRMDYTWDETSSKSVLFSIAQPDKHVLCTSAEADLMFGDKGTLSARGNSLENSFDCWKNKRRYYSSNRSWRYISNFNGDWLDTDNYMPFYMQKSIEKWTCNHNISGDMVYFDITDESWGEPLLWHKGVGYNPDAIGQEHYKKCKMSIRDFIYDITKDKSLSYQKGKNVSAFRLSSEEIQDWISLQDPTWESSPSSKELGKPLNVLAITGEGNVINRNNFNDYDWSSYIANL